MSVSVEDLGERTSALVEEVRRTRHEVVINEAGRPVAKIVPLEQRSTGLDELAAQLARRGQFSELKPEGESVVDELLQERRAEAAREDQDGAWQ